MSDIKRSRAKCLKCGNIIESKHRHHFIHCPCGAIFLDGGKDYVRYGGNRNDIQLLTEYHDDNHSV